MQHASRNKTMFSLQALKKHILTLSSISTLHLPPASPVLPLPFVFLLLHIKQLGDGGQDALLVAHHRNAHILKIVRR